MDAVDRSVICEIQFGLDDDADAAISADGSEEYFRVFRPARFHQRSIDERDTNPANRKDQRTQSHIASGRVDVKRTADGEVRVGLHDLDTEIVWIDVMLDIAPANAGLHAYPFLFAGKFQHPIELTHVQMEAVRTGRLPTHAEPSAADRNRALRIFYKLTQFLDGIWALDPGYDDGIESGHVVDGPFAAICHPVVVLLVINGRCQRSPKLIAHQLAAPEEKLPKQICGAQHRDERGQQPKAGLADVVQPF